MAKVVSAQKDYSSKYILSWIWEQTDKRNILKEFFLCKKNKLVQARLNQKGVVTHVKVESTRSSEEMSIGKDPGLMTMQAAMTNLTCRPDTYRQIPPVSLTLLS